VVEGVSALEEAAWDLFRFYNFGVADVRQRGQLFFLGGLQLYLG
jgi:hypothetical protein